MLTVKAIRSGRRFRADAAGTSRRSPPYKQRIAAGVEIRSVVRDANGVTLRFAGERPEQRFDHVVFATNGDRVLPLLANPTGAEREVLRNFQTSRNEVVLHTDDGMLPRRGPRLLELPAASRRTKRSRPGHDDVSHESLAIAVRPAELLCQAQRQWPDPAG